MKALYEELLPEIVEKFSIGSADNIEILRRMETGFSGAEVYEAELKNPSKFQGKFFLKIDPKDEEFYNHDIAQAFSHSVEYIEAKEIGGYYVLLIELAGKSGIEFKTFRDSQPLTCKNLMGRVIKNVLTESIDRASFAPARASISEICKQMLGSKASEGGPIETFLSSRIATPADCNIFFQDKIYPNPFYFVKKSVSLQDCYYLKARIHGDFHGENIFLAQNSDDYAIIDWALAREDGILFYDSAYFELSLLMQVFKDASLHRWIDLIEDICHNNWDNLDFEKADVIRQLHMREDAWITTINSAAFSHRDKMRVGQRIARIVAGLNFCGKTRVEDAKREYAFVFSCIFLNKLFEDIGYQDWKKLPPARWNCSTPDQGDSIKLAQYCSYFSEEYQYILICGSTLPQQELINEHLARIPWKGVLSLSTQDNEPLKAKIAETKFLRHLIYAQKDADQEATILHSDVWWAFFNGYASNPDSLAGNYPEWRNRYRKYIQRTIGRICTAASPQELMLVIAYDSLGDAEEKRKVQEILECFDADEGQTVSVAVLGGEQLDQSDTNNYANLRFKFFESGLPALADYAGDYLHMNRKAGIWLPQLDKKTGIQLEESDERYITTFLDIIGDHLLDPSASTQEVESFHWGEPITWDAIDRQMPISRNEAMELTKSISQRINQKQWGRIELSHAPGAGASVLVREVCWSLRKDYPIVRIKSICNDMFESLKRISAITSLPILILLDGDYGRSDAEAIETRLNSDLINRKYILLYTYRLYHMQEQPQLGILNQRDAENFERQYSNMIDHRNNYPFEEISHRKQELQQLTQTQILTEFRLPFFYGMYAFHDDFSNIKQYVEKIIQQMKADTAYCKVVSYLSIITYFTTSFGLSHKIAKKLLSKPAASLREIRDLLNNETPAFVYVKNSEYYICHPVIARKILQGIYGNNDGALETVSFSNICRQFIKDIRELDGGAEPSDYADRLVTSIFIKRSQIDRADNTQDTSRNTFSTIVQMLKNPHLQEEVFQSLVKYFSQNAHCFQHYGRLLSSHNPGEIDPARQQFEQAICLDEHNPIHYHARGIMYMRYCRYMLTRGNLTTPELIYNECKIPVENAIQDFKSAIEQTQQYPNREDGQLFNLAYPYSSILDICNMIVSKMKSCYERKHPEISFWESSSEAIRWCQGLLTMARQYAMNAAQECPDVGKNHHYKKSKDELDAIKLSQADLKALIETHPKDSHFKVLYLSNLDTRWDIVQSLNKGDLENSVQYCEEVIQSTGADSGLLWKWFQLYLHAPSFNESHALGFLESSQILDTNVTANYLLQILYFCRFYRTQDYQAADKALDYQRKCRELARGMIGGTFRRSCPFFLAESKPLPLTSVREKGTKLECTLIEDVVKEQSAHMTLNMDPRFQVVFVPLHNKGLKIGQGVGSVVNATIGFSYNGLYGFDLTLKESDK